MKFKNFGVSALMLAQISIATFPHESHANCLDYTVMPTWMQRTLTACGSAVLFAAAGVTYWVGSNGIDSMNFTEGMLGITLGSIPTIGGAGAAVGAFLIGKGASAKNQRISELKDLCSSATHNDLPPIFIKFYEDFIRKYPKTQLSFLDVYFHLVVNGLEKDQVCPNKVPMNNESILTWLSGQARFDETEFDIEHPSSHYQRSEYYKTYYRAMAPQAIAAEIQIRSLMEELDRKKESLFSSQGQLGEQERRRLALPDIIAKLERRMENENKGQATLGNTEKGSGTTYSELIRAQTELAELPATIDTITNQIRATQEEIRNLEEQKSRVYQDFNLKSSIWKSEAVLP